MILITTVAWISSDTAPQQEGICLGIGNSWVKAAVGQKFRKADSLMKMPWKSRPFLLNDHVTFSAFVERIQSFSFKVPHPQHVGLTLNPDAIFMNSSTPCTTFGSFVIYVIIIQITVAVVYFIASIFY
jgi:hypothetical protein